MRLREKKKLDMRSKILIVWLCLIAALVLAIVIVGLPHGEKSETIKEVMLDSVLHETNRISLFGLQVNPALVSAYIVTGVLLLFALILRIFVIPRFKYVPGRFQTAVEAVTEFFTGLADKNSPHKPGFVGAYIFSVGIYIFFGTLFELFGIQAVTTHGTSISLPAPVADINGAIAVGFTSYIVILSAGFIVRGVKGGLGVLKDFSLPVSMSFRLFGALLSGLLVTELVYYYTALSFVHPVIVGVLFTLLHALIQTYVLTTLVSIFYGEATEPKLKKEKTKKIKKGENQ
ncbi:MAG: F0F1 ATP synthase subunit A [Clostridia bacterium]|nr:F0F1 ATP synthase subunit A [Clostridia bacterium]